MLFLCPFFPGEGSASLIGNNTTPKFISFGVMQRFEERRDAQRQQEMSSARRIIQSCGQIFSFRCFHQTEAVFTKTTLIGFHGERRKE